jgi:hypothetical protein
MAQQRTNRPQTQAEIMMPRAEYEALVRRRAEEADAQEADDAAPQPDADPGNDDDDDDDNDEDNDPVDTDDDKPRAREVPIEERVCNEMIAMYQRVLGFSPGAAIALYDDQGITTLEHLQEVTDSLADETCRAIQKPGGDEWGHPIPIIARQRLKLLAFWSRPMWRTSHEPDDIHKLTWYDIKHLSDQKTLEDNHKDGKDPPVPEMTLEQTNAAACFVQMRQCLRKLCSRTTGLPLNYVIWVTLKGPFDLPDAKDPDPPLFGELDSPYVSIKDELVTQAPIIDRTLSRQDLSQNVAILEREGPFERTFIADSAAVYDILHTVWGKSSWWTYCKPYEKTKNRRQVFRTLHAQLLGGPRVVATRDTIINRIQTLVYEGDRRHFTFDKYVHLHVDQHNLHNDLTDYGVAPLAKSMKILWFQKGI